MVESSIEGRPLYESEGFKVEIENYVCTLPEEFVDVDTQTFIWMTREARKTAQESQVDGGEDVHKAAGDHEDAGS